MPLNREAIMNHAFQDREHTLTDLECILYALSLGVCRDPLNADELAYVYEEAQKVFPSMPVVLGHPGPWMADPRMGIDRQMLVHGTQYLEIHAPMQVGVPYVGRNRILELVDKGADRGGIIVSERTLRDKASGRLLARMESSTFCRADGGFGGQSEMSRAFAAVPDREPDIIADMPTDPNQALWYRLNGDRNPLHASPPFAARAGFSRPILHGLCSFGVATHALLRHAGMAGELHSIGVRFSKPVYPGETIRVEMWRSETAVAFRATVPARDVVVLDRGCAAFR